MELLHVGNSALPSNSPVKPFSFKANQERYLYLMTSALKSGPSAVHSLLLADHWVSLRINKGTHAESVLIETVFELVRQNQHSLRPCRWESAFFFDSVESAERFRSNYRPNGIIHRCEIENGEPFIADMALINPGINLHANIEDELNNMYARAAEYWQSHGPMSWPEILVKGTVIVKEVLK